MKTRRNLYALTLTGAVALLVAGCSKTSAPADVSTATPSALAPAAAAALAKTVHKHSDAPGINWFSGEVGAVFTAAKLERKPILLYWGASWCPPCQQLKSTVFSRPDFIRKSRLFVPVYLDGDDVGAQKWGEQFHVSGYPTVVVLNADAQELMRIAGGMDLGQYATVLDTALADLQPAEALLIAASSGKSLDLGPCRRLAFNSWEIENDDDTAANAKLSQQLDAAVEHCPQSAQIERARLQIFAANFATQAEAETLKNNQPPSALLLAHVETVNKVLTNERIAVEVADALQYLGENFFRTVKASDASSAAWLAHFVTVMDAAAADPDFAEADQLGAIGSKLTAIKTIKGAIATGVARAARARVASALADTQIPYVRSGIINAVLPIYEALGQNEQAYKVVQGELTKTATPYYYKADLGELAEGLGRKDEALKWFAASYSEARGPATRFQWGKRYASSLLRLQPEDAARIRNVTTEVLGELDGQDRIYRRARMSLEDLDKALRKWNTANKGAHHEVIVGLRERMQQICGKIPKTEPAHASCDAFLASA